MIHESHSHQEEILAAAARDEALSLVELEDVTGYCYNTLRRMAKMPGFPLRFRKVLPSQFREWLLKQPVERPEELAAA